MKPALALTMGDAAGIGPEIVVKAIAALKRTRRDLRIAVFGDRACLGAVARRGGLRLDRLFDGVVRPTTAPAARWPGVVLIDFANAAGVRPGRGSAVSGRAAGAYIEAATEAVLRGAADVLVTAPINKAAFGRGGWGRRFIGHTEMLAALTHSKKVALLLASGPLKAIHVTSHIPLRAVPLALSVSRIAETIRLADAGAKAFGLRKPRIAVCGLNPHAGDEGILGREERRLIAPAVRRAKSAGLRVSGPLSPDVVWPQMAAGRFDIGVAMYHDQGQIPVKLIGVARDPRGTGVPHGVNVTIGLPIIRTSPAHGTGYDIAGRNRASPASLLEAIETAEVLWRHRR